MTVFGVAPHVIEDEWTWELLLLMLFRCQDDREEAEQAAAIAAETARAKFNGEAGW